MQNIERDKIIVIEYTNYKGETSSRRIVPECIKFVNTRWHPECQWILEAYDLGKESARSFAMKDILAWKPEKSKSDVPDRSATAISTARTSARIK